MYRAIDIASYILDYYKENDIYITNLKLQKLLYLVQCEFIKKTGKLCFSDTMQAWTYGPVVPEVYNIFSKFVSNEILDWSSPQEIPNKKEKHIIDDVLLEYKDTDAWDLVKITHNQSPWKDTYKKNRKERIPNEILFKYISKDDNNG